MTKHMLHQEWNMALDEAIDAEAQAQAICMATNDFHRAYHAFVEPSRSRPSRATDVTGCDHLDWPFFEQRHRTSWPQLETWARNTSPRRHPANVDETCRRLVRQLGDGGWLKYAIGERTAYGESAATASIHARSA